MNEYINMAPNFRPFYFNSCWDEPDEDTIENKLFAVSGNVGNKYLMYSILRLLYGNNVPDKIEANDNMNDSTFIEISLLIN